MKTIAILMALLFVGLTGYAQEEGKSRWDRIEEIVKEKGWSETSWKDRKKAELEYQKRHQAEIHRLSDEFYLWRDTLYLLWDEQDSMQFKDRGYVWRLYDIEKELKETEPSDIGNELSYSERLALLMEIRLAFDKIWHFQGGVGISLSEEQLATLRPASRKELVDFFKRELKRAREQKLRPIDYPMWGLWNLLDYFPKVYMLVPKGGDFYDMYECEY
ncbi:MAG: hypothetical protein SOR65_08160 [Odoribacter sp.]|nr:hypothetical protein [Odoribacter sp.]